MSGDVAILDVAAMGSIRSLLISGSKVRVLVHPPSNQSLENHSRGIKLERFAFVPTLALYVLVLFGGSGKLDRRGGGMLPARARAAP